MSKAEKGFGLIEVMIAVTLGIVVVLGITQIFVSAKQSYLTQDATSRLQEDARYVLSRMVQDIRMAGMFGCLPASALDNLPSDFASPVEWDNGEKKLSLVTASVADGREGSSSSTWTITTDCLTRGAVHDNSANPGAGELAFPIRKLAYKYDVDAGTLSVASGSGEAQPLVSGVSDFTVSFGLAATAGDSYVAGNYEETVSDAALIRSVRLSLTMHDADGRTADQTYSVVAALRNRLP
ncbi:type IV pilus assembly protein PilW [Pseudomonas sp. URMO17WK12:I1]|uniref:PilW family protein n=1 Tax=unclassified Pseudomonas TaxID=196821 RepID=UPI0009DE53FE|nr:MULTISPECIES: prepilin-type N-terminal cleavage/methylation domain-containing protein [unclassified Pseudomonas]PZW63815.1 type IV pilus assembly protein PilW [Pseudomonas sp. URMO17WK12:I1]